MAQSEYEKNLDELYRQMDDQKRQEQEDREHLVKELNAQEGDKTNG